MDEKISQIKFDKNFIKKLLEKLKVGNTRSIHLNALPGRSATRLDLFQLSSIKDIYPSSFLEVLLKDENFSFDINFDNLNIGDLDEEDKKRLSLISKRLNTLVIENDDNFLEYGIKNFGFGFPLLIKRDKDDPSKIIKAPLFIWNLDIKRSYREKNHWTICREEDAAIKINELLISHLSKDELIQLEKIPKEILEDGILDEQELLSLCDQILSQLNVDDSDLKVRIEKCPEQKFIESVANSKPWIQWSGIFGIYRSQKETIIHATEELLEHFDEFESENLILEKFQTSTISPVETDPSKEEIINTLTKDEIKLIQGPPGTGKSQSITAIISNVLANSGKCLVVCEKKTALDIIDTNLKNMGLGDFVVLIDDVNKDRKKVIEQARSISDNPGYTNFSKLDFQEKTRKFLQLKDDLNAKYAEVSKKVFGDFSWKQLIGLFIRYSKTKDFEIINESLECEPLKFDHEEYTKYLNIVEESAILYSELESDSEKTFSLLSPQIFSDGYKWSTHETIKKETKKYLSELRSIKEFLSQIEQSECVEGIVTVFNPGKIAEAAIQIEELIKHLKSIKFLGGQILEIAKERRDSLIKILSKVNLFLSEKNANDFIEDCVSVYKPDLIKPVIDCTDKIIIESEQLLHHYDEGIKLVGKKFNNKSLLHEYLLRLLSFKNKKYKDSLNLKRKIVNCLNCVKKDIASLRRMGFVEIQNANFSKQKTLLQITEDIKTKLVEIKNVNAKIKSIENFYHFLDSINKEIELTQTNNIFIYKSKTIEEFTSFEEMTKFYNDLYLKVSQSSDILMQNFLEQKDEKAQEYKNNLLSLYTNEIQCAKKCEELELFNFAPSDPVQGNITINNFCIEINNLFDRAEKTKLKIVRIDDINRKLENYEQKFSEIKKNGLFFDELVGYRNFNDFNQVNGQYTNLLEVISSLDNHIDSYESYHNWKFFELKRTETELRMIAALKNSPTEKWGNLFKAWYYKGALINFENNSKVGFNKTNTKLEQLTILYRELKEQQLKQIKSAWQNQRRSKLAALSFNFNALYNLRKNKSFNRRNSLRKIIETDFNLFTTLFPVILTNPVAANAILPLKQGLFEIVIFDEASQLRIADTFTSLIRGQYKIIAGDEHQMPPSSYFQSSGEILDSPDQDTENDDDEEEEAVFSKEDEQAVLAESESLLEYGKDLRGINKSYLDFHYRSKHPALIDFSNCAFYGGNLIPFPAREVYKPIEFRAVNGRYDSRVNQKEVIEVLKILQNEIHPDHKGKYPSVGIATFNINQRNLITEAINEAAENDSSFAQKMQELKERGLFVKNLENIQGDERDIIIISTTYGIKPDGKFSQNFARLNRIEGYKLLNVLITRAKNKLYVCTSIPKEKYISYSDIVQNEGNNKKGILYAYLAYAEAISNNDIDSAESILNVLKEKSYEPPRIMSSNQGLSESVFEEEVYEELLEHFKKEQIVQQYKVGGFRLDFVVKNKSFDIVLECDGKAYHQTDEAYAYDMFRQKELEDMGFIVYRIWSTNWFQDKEHEMQKFLNFVKDKEECPARKL